MSALIAVHGARIYGDSSAQHVPILGVIYYLYQNDSEHAREIEKERHCICLIAANSGNTLGL